jgi:cytochrome c oxidase subunit 3
MSAATTAAIEVPPRSEPQRARELMSAGVMGMVIFVFTEVMLFAGMVSAQTIVRSQAVGEMWPPYGQPRLPVADTALNTAALLLSGVLLVAAHLAYRKEARRAVAPALLALLLGVFFVGAQGMEWIALLREGLTLTSSTYGSFFYLIVGTHAIHAVVAILALSWAWFRLRSGRLTASQFGTVQVFWYFVVLVWPLLYLKVYL